jgi:hypothetical protein
MALRVAPLKREVPAPLSPFWKRYPLYGYAAILINILAWSLAWSRIDPFYRYTFFPLWLSFILALDALNKARSGTSLLTRAPAKFGQLFLFSIICWWTFEGLNIPAANWHYINDHHYSTLAYILVASLDFSTVLPAVLECAELWASFPSLRPRLRPSAKIERITPQLATRLIFLGAFCILPLFIWPKVTFVLIWLSLGFLLDPINNLMGRKSALAHFKARDWRFFIIVPLAGLTCGFFWEMWNYFSLPKWFYTIPVVGFGKVFEMPILGYSGYLPFAIELFALYQFLLLVVRQQDDALNI